MKAIVSRINFVLLLLVVLGLLIYSRSIQAGDNLSDKVVGELNQLDQKNQNLLNQVINSANSAASSNSNVTFGNSLSQESNQTGFVTSGSNQADISGTGGVALIEHAKDQQQTLTTNVGSIMSNMNATKMLQRKIGGQ